jgi:hypothetical protein
MQRRFLCVLVLLLSCAYGEAHAWGRQGHETVGLLAGGLIVGTHAEQQVKALLKPDETMASAAVWADCAKGFMYCRAQPTAEMQDYAKRNPHHHNYHFADIPADLPGYAEDAVGAQADDVVHVIRDAILVLQGQSVPSGRQLTQREALFLLVHLVGDIHQPLHVGAAYINSDLAYVTPGSEDEAKTEATQGGNLMCRGSKGLHSAWDDDFVARAMKSAKVSSSADFAKSLQEAAAQRAVDPGDSAAWPALWASQSVQLAKQQLDPISIDGTHPISQAKSPCAKSTGTGSGGAIAWEISWESEYPDAAAVVAANQIMLAGARLAHLLEAIWP